MRIVLTLVWKEYLHVFRDRATTFQVIAIPLIQLIVLGLAATFEIRETPVYLVDADRSPASRGLAQRFDASEHFRIIDRSTSLDAADRALLAGEVTLILHVPRGFETDLVRQRTARVQLVLNAEQGAAAGIVRAYATRVLTDHALETGERIRATAPSGSMTYDERGAASPSATAAQRIDLRTRGWYNAQLAYTDYMVPGILVALVTLIGTLLTAQNITREKELGTLEQLNATPVTRGQFIAGKLIPFWILGMVELGAGLALARLVFGIPMRGNLVIVFGVAAVYLVGALALGLLISTVAHTQQQAMFVTFFVMMIYLLMSGLYTPITSMPLWAQTLAELVPVKHFVVVMRAVLVRGAGPAEIAAPTAALAGFAVATLALSVRQYSKRSG